MRICVSLITLTFHSTNSSHFGCNVFLSRLFLLLIIIFDHFNVEVFVASYLLIIYQFNNEIFVLFSVSFSFRLSHWPNVDSVAVIILGIITLIVGVLLSSIPWIDYFILKVSLFFLLFRYL